MTAPDVKVRFPKYRARWEVSEEPALATSATGGMSKTVKAFCPFCDELVTTRTFFMTKSNPEDRTDDEQAAIEAMGRKASKVDREIFWTHLTEKHPTEFPD